VSKVEEAAKKKKEMLEEAHALELRAAGCLSEMTPEQLFAACDLLKLIRKMNKEVDATFDDLISGQNETLKKTRARKKKFADPLTAAENVIKSKINDYYDREFQTQAQEYANKINLMTEAAESQRAGEVAQLRAAGMDDQADAKEREPLALVPIPKPAPTKVDGISVSELWKAEITDEDALIEFALEHAEWRHLLSISTKELNILARMQKDSMAIPGARAVRKPSISIRLKDEEDEGTTD
jgi:hypothetical protein